MAPDSKDTAFKITWPLRAQMLVLSVVAMAAAILVHKVELRILALVVALSLLSAESIPYLIQGVMKGLRQLRDGFGEGRGGPGGPRPA